MDQKDVEKITMLVTDLILRLSVMEDILKEKGLLEEQDYVQRLEIKSRAMSDQLRDALGKTDP